MDMKDKRVKAAREAFLKAQTELLYAALAGGMKLPGPAIAGAISAIRAISSLKPRSDENYTENSFLAIDEIEEFFREENKYSDALRKVVLDARPAQVKSLIRGYLVNYVYDW